MHELLEQSPAGTARVLVFTDDATGATNLEARALHEGGVEVSVMGIGTAAGAPIPHPRGGFLKDADGTIVVPITPQMA